MNPLEKNVASLEMSKKMHDAGITFKTAFVWVMYAEEMMVALRKNFTNGISAPTPTEMIDRLPAEIKIKNELHFLFMNKNILSCGKITYEAGYNNAGDSLANPFISEPTLKEALSKLCLWCEEEGYL